MNANPTYAIGAPALKNIWVDPQSGDDKRAGATRAAALRTLTRAWALIPDPPAQAGHGWQILLCPGRYAADARGQITLTDRHATTACPIIIRAADAPLSAELPPLDLARCDALYLMDVRIASPGIEGLKNHENNLLHFAASRDILVRRVTARGSDAGHGRPFLVVKANQCLRVYIEDCDFACAAENAIDYVAVQYGHIVRNRLHDCRAECMYVKGGSAHHLIAANEMCDSVNHGVLAGQCTGFQYLVPPWLHYEAYDIKVVNNVIHDAGSGLAVCGGYNILMAWNTCFRVGSSRDAIVVGLGGRGWIGGRPPIVDTYFAAGGWCSPGGDGFNIPNRHVRICNNIILNPDGYESRHAHFGISGPVATPAGSNIPSPARADDDLVISGNIVWNGPADKLLLDDVANMYHLAARPDIDPARLTGPNRVNTLRPEFADPEQGDFQPRPGGSLYRVRSVPIPDFTWDDAPKVPPVPVGNPDNRVPHDRAGRPRTPDTPIGAYV